MYLDLISVNLKIVPEYPDLVEEAQEMREALSLKDLKMNALALENE